MKIFIVTSGEYSGYGIEAVFSSLDKAERYCSIKNNTSLDYYGIEDYEMDAVEIAEPKLVECKYNPKNYLGCIFYFREVQEAIKPRMEYNATYGDTFICTVKFSMNQEIMKNSVYDKLALFKAQQEHI